MLFSLGMDKSGAFRSEQLRQGASANAEPGSRRRGGFRFYLSRYPYGPRTANRDGRGGPQKNSHGVQRNPIFSFFAQGGVLGSSQGGPREVQKLDFVQYSKMVQMVNKPENLTLVVHKGCFLIKNRFLGTRKWCGFAMNFSVTFRVPLSVTFRVNFRIF